MEALLAQGIPEADRVAQALDLYVNGSLNFFNHRTTVDIRNRLVCFDIKGLGKNLKKPGMLIVQDAVWNTVTINRAIGRSTWYFVDEFHLLLKEEQTAAYSAEIWKRFRKWGGVPTGATQNPKMSSCPLRTTSRRTRSFTSCSPPSPAKWSTRRKRRNEYEKQDLHYRRQNLSLPYQR